MKLLGKVKHKDNGSKESYRSETKHAKLENDDAIYGLIESKTLREV